MKNHMIICLLFLAFAGNAQSFQDVQYQAYLSGDQALTLWKQAVTICQAAVDKNTGNDSVLFNLTLAQYGVMNATMRTKDEDTFDAYYDKAIDHIKPIIDRNKKWGDPMALQSAMYGLKMGFSPMQGMVLGSKSSSLVEKATKLSPDSPFVWKVYATSKYFTPEMFGGDLDEAIDAYKKSIQLFETKAMTKTNWHYLDALAFLGQAYIKKGNKTEAVATLEKALKAEPGFGWVKNVLLPKAKAMK